MPKAAAAKPGTRLTETGLVRPDAPARADTAGLVMTDEAVVEMRVDEVTRALHRLTHTTADGHPDQLALVPRIPKTGRRAVVGMRYLLPTSEGSGYWDFFSASDHLLISITDTVYRHHRWVPVDDSRYFKLRFMLSGRLLTRSRETLLEGGQAVAHVSPRSTEAGGGYFVEGGQQTRMVVLHGRKELLTDMLGLGAEDTPPPLDRMLGPPGDEISQSLSFSPKILRAVRDMVDSRHELPAQLRTSYIESKAIEVLSLVIAELTNRSHSKRLEIRISPRELNCIYETRDYLAQHFVAPPTISKLARMVGINQTKLKAGFKQALGMTIYHYIIKLRMEHASTLLLSDEHSISSVAYLVGYDYPANFTIAFKKHFGVLPRAWKDRRNRQSQG
jgi:AraC-like DNA-binding protein